MPAFTSVAQLPDGSIPTGASSPSARPTITVVPANYHNPYTLNWNVSIQRAVKKDYMVELSYVGMHNIGFSGNYNWNSRPWGTGIDANGKVIDLSLPENWAYRSTWVNNTSGVNGTQAYKVYPNLGGVNYQCNCVRMIYHSGTIKVEKRYSYGLSFLTFATWQKGIQNAPGNLYQSDQLMRAVTGQTQKYRYVSSMTYELPFGKGKKWMNHSRMLDAVLGGWSYSWNFSVWAPTPVSLGYSGGTYTNPVTGAVGARQTYPNYEPDPGSQLLPHPDSATAGQLAGHRNQPLRAERAEPAGHQLRHHSDPPAERSDVGQPVRRSSSFVHPRQHAQQLLPHAADHRGQRVHLQGIRDQGARQGANPDGLLQPVQMVQLGQRQSPP